MKEVAGSYYRYSRGLIDFAQVESVKNSRVMFRVTYGSDIRKSFRLNFSVELFLLEFKPCSPLIKALL